MVFVSREVSFSICCDYSVVIRGMNESYGTGEEQLISHAVVDE